MAGSDKNQIPQFLIYIFMIMMIVTGSINTIANKLQNISKSLERPYKHEWFITFCMFFGESLCLIVYYISQIIASKKNQKDSSSVDAIKLLSEESVQREKNAESTSDEIDSNPLPVASPFQLMLPALCDFIGSTVMTFGLSMIAGSIYQMLRGSLIIFTAIFSIIFLKSKIYRHNFLGITSVLLGLVLVGFAAFNKTPEPGCGGGAEASDNVVLGFCLVIFAQIFTATQFIIEENFMKKYDCPALKAVGWEGVWGCSFYIVFLIIAQNVSCSPPVGDEKNFATLICSYNERNEYFVEDTLFAFRQLGANRMLLFYCILYVCSIGIFNFVGITISKVLSSPARAVLDTIRTIVVWLFFIFPIVDKCHREQFQFLQLIGFIFLIIGTVIYNEILPIPFFGFDKYLKKNMVVDNNENKTKQEHDV
jgi:hypothetical protein